MDNLNIIDFSFLDNNEKKYDYTVLIILNRPILDQQYNDLIQNVDYVICADGAANRLYDCLKDKSSVPNCIVGDFDSIRQDVQEYYKDNNVKLLLRNNCDTTDLEKSLYVSLEKISDISANNLSDEKSYAIIILGSSGGRVDHSYATYSQVFKYINVYNFELKQTDIFLMSKSSVSVFLTQGDNKIISSRSIQNKEYGYSILSLLGEARISVHEVEDNVSMGNIILNQLNV
jgi:thiamine pyrophosphokinase